MRPLAGRVFKITTGRRFIQGLQHREGIEFRDREGVDDIPLAGTETFGLGQGQGFVDCGQFGHATKMRRKAGLSNSGRRRGGRGLDRGEKDALFRHRGAGAHR